MIVDHFTCFAQAYTTTSKAGKTDRIFNDYGLKFRFPIIIHHDQGGKFENQLFKECRSTVVSQHQWQLATIHRGMDRLKTLIDRQKTNWKAYLNKLLYAHYGNHCDMILSNLSPVWMFTKTTHWHAPQLELRVRKQQSSRVLQQMDTRKAGSIQNCKG